MCRGHWALEWDLDVWTFIACDGDAIQLQLAEINGNSAFAPWLRLYAPDGTLLNTEFNATVNQLSRTAPLLGTYTVVVSDASSGLAASGDYRLTGTGIATGLTLCGPLISSANVIFRAAGGQVNGPYVLLTATNVTDEATRPLRSAAASIRRLTTASRSRIPSTMRDPIPLGSEFPQRHSVGPFVAAPV